MERILSATARVYIWRLPNGSYVCIRDGIGATGKTPEEAYNNWRR